MRFGLLKCDSIPEELRGSEGDNHDMFRAWLPGEWTVFDLQRGEVPASVQDCDAWLTTGSRASVYEDVPWIHGFAEIVRAIRDAEKPYVGICFGHQMLGHALGGVVRKCPRGWGVGVHRFRVMQREPWMEPEAEEFAVVLSCQDQVEEVPPGGVVLAGNEHCPVGMFRVGRMLGIQGHPEYSVAYAGRSLAARAARIGEERVAKARESFAISPDGDLLGAWVRGFLAD